MACQFQEQHDLFQHSEDFKPLAIPLQISIICLGKAQMGTRPQTKHISKCWELWLQQGLYHGNVSVSVSFWSILVVHQCTGNSTGTMNGEEFHAMIKLVKIRLGLQECFSITSPLPSFQNILLRRNTWCYSTRSISSEMFLMDYVQGLLLDDCNMSL